MTYTIWSKQRLVGESDLSFPRRLGDRRAGYFFPTALGEGLMPIATGVPPAARALLKAHRREDALHRDDATPTPLGGGESTAITTARADLAASEDRRAALELELRGADGVAIPTEWIDIQDSDQLLTLVTPDAPIIECADAPFTPDDADLDSIEGERARHAAWERSRRPDETESAPSSWSTGAANEDDGEINELAVARYRIVVQFAASANEP